MEANPYMGIPDNPYMKTEDNPYMKDEPSVLSSITSDIGKGASKTLGVVVGAANAPLAFIRGMQNAPIDASGGFEEWNKLPWYQKPLVMLGGGFESAARSIGKEGDWGESYDRYYKATSGRTLEQDFGKGANYIRLALDLTNDPMVGPAIGADLAKQGVTTAGQFMRYIRRGEVSLGAKEVVKIPKTMMSDINKLDKLDVAEKDALRQNLVDLLRGKAQGDAALQKGDALRQGKVASLLEEGKVEPIPQELSVGKSLPEYGKGSVPEEIVIPRGVASTEDVFSEAPLPPPKREKRIRTLKDDPEKTPYWLKRVGKDIPEKDRYTEAKRLQQKYLDSQVAMHGAGAITGVDVDEEGNPTYDFAKGAGGAALGMAAFKMAPFLKKSAAAQKLYDQNPNWSKVHDMIGQDKTPFSFMGLWNDVWKMGIDKFEPINKVSRETYDAAIKYQSYKDVAAIKMSELDPYFKPFGKKDSVMVSEYIAAKRAINRAENGIKNPNNVTLADAQGAVKEIEATYQAKGGDINDLRKAADGFHNWAQRNILKEALDNGFISQEAYNKIKANNSFYATFDVLAHMPEDMDKIPILASNEYFSMSNQKIIKAMKGTEKAIDDPIEATIRKFASAQAQFAQNKVASTFIDDMISNPDPVKQAMIRPLAQTKKEFDILTKQGMNPVASVPDGWDTINRMKNGNVEKYVAPKEITESMKQLKPWQAPKAVQAMNSIFRSSATTLYLPFTVGNAVRDAFMAFVTSPVYRGAEVVKFPVDWLKGAYEGLKYEFANNSKAVEGYLKHGGGFGWTSEVRDATATKEKLFKGPLQIVMNQANLFKQIEKLSGAIELAPRMAVYERAIKQGGSMDDAATLARKATIDFNRSGSLLKVLNQFVPFLNARVQARTVMAEALKSDPKGTIAKGFMAAVLPGAALYAYNRQHFSDLYDDIPRYTRDNYFTFITGETKDEKGNTVPTYFVIPKGDVGQMLWNPIEHFIDKVWKDDKKSTTEFLTQFASDLSPIAFANEGKLSASLTASNVTPPAVKAVYENITNKNLYTGQDIVPYFMEKNKPPELQFKEKTPETYKWIAKELKDKANISMSPLKMQNFMSNIIAGYGREGLDPAAMMKGLTGRFYKEQGGQKERDIWDLIKEIETGYNTARSYAEQFVRDGDRPSALKLMQKWNEGMDKQVERMGKGGISDKGGVRRDYFFTFEKMKGVMQSGMDTRSALQKKISVK
jgi:hypothetical protein